jgi:hypothetical protein
MSNTTPEPEPTSKDDGTATTDGRGKPSGTTTDTSPVAKPQGRGKPS